jgi:outer membrane lipoprotein-sorting protein
MRTALLLAVVRIGVAQTTPNADALLAKVGDVAREAKTWQAVGVVTTSDLDGKNAETKHFKIAYRQSQPFSGRLEISDGPDPLLRICDGSSQWTYYTKRKLYVRVALNQTGPCTMPFNAWPPIRNTTSSPELAGIDRIMIEGRPRPCQVVRGIFTPTPNSPRTRTRTVCIDTATNTVLRYQVRDNDPPKRITTTTFSSIRHDVDLDSPLFKFDPPEGIREAAIINWTDPLVAPDTGAFRVSNSVTSPLLVNMEPAEPPSVVAVPPKPGIVILHVEISADGVPGKIRVIQGLGSDWDRKAIESVGKWRFEPGVSDKGPVPVASVVGVRF